MIRVKIEDRKMFHIDDKIAILCKTDFKCAHCGKPLGYSDMTIDHVIPISKAGTNDDINIVPLCEKCNKEKGNLIIPPSFYYFYLREKYREPLVEAYEEYLGNVDYLTMNNFLPIDYFNFSSNSGDLIISSKYYTKSPKRAYLIKSQKRDIEEVYSAYLRYFSKNGVKLTDIQKTALGAELENWYDRGAVYTLKNVSGDIVLILPMRLQYSDLSEHVIQESGDSLVLTVGRVALLYKKNNYIEGLAHFLLYLLSNGISVFTDVFSVYINISFYDFDYDVLKFVRYVIREACYMRLHNVVDKGGNSLLVEGVNIPYKYGIEESKKIAEKLQSKANLVYKDTEKMTSNYPLSAETKENLQEYVRIPTYEGILYMGSLYEGR